MLIRIGEVAKIIERTTLTIKHWYQWQEENGVNPILGELPPIYRQGKRNDRYFEYADIPKLVHFRDQLRLNPGLMREYNRKRKGYVGQLQQERAEFKKMLKSL